MKLSIVLSTHVAQFQADALADPGEAGRVLR